jgi:hypothetical protein
VALADHDAGDGAVIDRKVRHQAHEAADGLLVHGVLVDDVSAVERGHGLEDIDRVPCLAGADDHLSGPAAHLAYGRLQVASIRGQRPVKVYVGAADEDAEAVVVPAEDHPVLVLGARA